jgi:hypothetical protein
MNSDETGVFQKSAEAARVCSELVSSFERGISAELEAE